LGGFFGSKEGSGAPALTRKRKLLAEEGVHFDSRLRLATLPALFRAADFDAKVLARARAQLRKPSKKPGAAK